MYILSTSPGKGQILCKVWLASVERRRCSNETKTREPLKLAGVPQTTENISVASGPKFAILEERVGETNFFPIVDTCLSCEDIARQICELVPIWRIFGDFLHRVLLASRMQRVSDLYLKFALRSHHVWKYGRHPISDR